MFRRLSVLSKTFFVLAALLGYPVAVDGAMEWVYLNDLVGHQPAFCAALLYGERITLGNPSCN